MLGDVCVLKEDIGGPPHLPLGGIQALGKQEVKTKAGLKTD